MGELLLVQAREFCLSGNAAELRLLFDACTPEEIGKIILTKTQDDLRIKRPSSSNDYIIKYPNLLEISLAGWYTDIFDCLVSHGLGLGDFVGVSDFTCDPGKPNYNSTPLIIASMLGKVEMVKSLVSHGADIDGTNSIGDSSLLEACFEGNYAVTEFLVQKRASLNKQNERGITGEYSFPHRPISDI